MIIIFTNPAYAGKDFLKKDLFEYEIKNVDLAAQKNARKNGVFTIVIYGGKRPQQMAAYKAAQRLDEEGIKVSFLLASDEDNDPNN